MVNMNNLSEEEKKAIEYYQNKEVSFSVGFDTEKLLKALGITEEDSFENHQIRFKTLLNLIEKLQKENEEKTTILLAGAEKVKQLEKENKDLKADNYELNNRITDLLENIPVQKVKDKIEELKKKVEELTDEQGYWGGSDLLEQIKVLQELVGERK